MTVLTFLHGPMSKRLSVNLVWTEPRPNRLKTFLENNFLQGFACEVGTYAAKGRGNIRGNYGQKYSLKDGLQFKRNWKFAKFSSLPENGRMSALGTEGKHECLGRVVQRDL